MSTFWSVLLTLSVGSAITLLIAMNALAALFAKERPYSASELPPAGLGRLGSRGDIRRAHLRAIKYRRARGGAR